MICLLDGKYGLRNLQATQSCVALDLIIEAIDDEAYNQFIKSLFIHF